MNIVISPFHDWRKILMEGFRTRDAHFIEELNKNKNHIKIVVNRPTTIIEILLKKKRNLISGRVVLSKRGFKLYEIENNFYVIDFVSKDIIGQVLNGYNWFVNQYGNKKYIAFINDCLNFLKIKDNYCLLNQNVFAFKLSEKLNPKTSIFDAWDNFLKFKVYKGILDKIDAGYKSLAKNTNFWITNSNDNISDLGTVYNPKRIHLIKNGVDVTRFTQDIENQVPEDMANIPRPIVGFGGKITQLIDVKLINDTMRLSPKTSFVFVGQILDKHIFDAIEKRDNFFYLGDKHYDEYPNYVKNFDICIVPYVVKKEKKSGANSIKVYEYLATNKKVVGTNSNGLEDLTDHLFIVNTANEFSSALESIINNKTAIDLGNHSWKSKIEEFLQILNEN